VTARWRWVLLASLCLLQWGIPLAMVQHAEQVLAQGTAYRFRTAPVDPADPFRGRYVTLEFEAAQVRTMSGWHAETGARLYAPIVVGVDGFATLALPQSEPPSRGDWLVVRLQWRDDERQEARVALPFDRYYLDEDLAPAAEQLYWESNRVAPGDTASDPHRPAWVSVRVLDGHAQLEELYIDDVPVRERVKAAGAPHAP
jgi:uncharacterized membrane-anchored protein